MSAINEAKALCGYEAKPVHRTCGNCAAFQTEKVLPEWMRKKNATLTIGEIEKTGFPYRVEVHRVETNLRCNDYGFATKRTASSRMWRQNVE